MAVTRRELEDLVADCRARAVMTVMIVMTVMTVTAEAARVARDPRSARAVILMRLATASVVTLNWWMILMVERNPLLHHPQMTRWIHTRQELCESAPWTRSFVKGGGGSILPIFGCWLVGNL